MMTVQVYSTFPHIPIVFLSILNAFAGEILMKISFKEDKDHACYNQEYCNTNNNKALLKS